MVESWPCAPVADTGGFASGGLQDLNLMIEGLSASWIGENRPTPARKLHRRDFLDDFAVTPLDDAELRPDGPMRLVQGRDVCRDGVSFQHRAPLTCRFAALTFRLSDERTESVVARLKWCRFTRSRTYRSGAQFLRLQSFGWERSLNLARLPLG